MPAAPNHITLVTAFVLTAIGTMTGAQTYDTVILNGRVMDPETGFDQIANVGISAGWIVDITDEFIEGRETIDASGHVVAPGFIDTHFHALDGLSSKASLRDGVTTGMDMELGAMNVAEWYAAKEKNWPVNYGTVISHEMARMIVHDGMTFDGPSDATTGFINRAKAGEDGVNGWSVTISDLDQINEITAIIDQGLAEGAIGIGSTVGYMSTGVSSYEMLEVQRAAARYGRPTAFHARLHGSTKPPVEAQMGFNEVFTNAFLLDAPLLYQHNNDYGWWEIEEKLQLARAKGLNMWSEHYPYEAASTNIGADALKPDALAAAGLSYEDNIYDPDADAFITEDIYNELVQGDPAKIMVAFNKARIEWMPFWLRMPHMTVGSDAMWSGLEWEADYEEYSGHPRTAGSHAKTLRLGREQNIPLMQSLSQLSYWSALHLGDAGVKAMQVRGRMQEGMVADITIFDPETVTDNATYKAGEHLLPSTGIPWVIVNGQIVVRDSVAEKVMAGQPIRFEPEAPRHVPASTKQWIDTFTVTDGGLDPVYQPSGNDDALLKPQPEMPLAPETGNIKTASASHWFGDQKWPSSDLFLCPVHGVYEDRYTVQKDWVTAMLARMGTDSKEAFDPLVSR